MPYVLTTQAQVDWLYAEYPLMRHGERYIGFVYRSGPLLGRVRENLELRAAPEARLSRPRYQNHHEPEILNLP